jgi:hypothetical protein
MNKKRWLLTAIASGAVVLIALAWSFWPRAKDNWPDFADIQGPAPALSVEYDQRDFGWRIGDVVPVTVYVKQFAGTEVEVDGLAFDGDFEQRGDAQLTSRNTADGGKLYRIKVNLQSFASKEELSSRISLTWHAAGKKASQEIGQAKLSVRTSKTWDGRPEIQEGKPAFVQGWHLVKTLVVGLVSLAGLVICVVYIRWQILLLPRLRRRRKVTREEWAKARFDSAWAHIAGGDRDPVWFRRIDYTLRRYLGAEAILWTKLPDALRKYPYRQQALTGIGLCERVLDAQATLSEQELIQLHTAFHDIVLGRPVPIGPPERYQGSGALKSSGLGGLPQYPG